MGHQNADIAEPAYFSFELLWVLKNAVNIFGADVDKHTYAYFQQYIAAYPSGIFLSFCLWFNLNVCLFYPFESYMLINHDVKCLWCLFLTFLTVVNGIDVFNRC